MNKVKLIEYVLGNISPDSDNELKKLLQTKGIDKEIAKINEEIEQIASTVTPVKASSHLKSSIFSHIDEVNPHSLDGMANRVADFFQLPINKIQTMLKSVSDLTLPHWEKTFIKGAYLYHFKAGGDIAKAHCGLIYLKADTKVQEHEHLGEEHMLVLTGEIKTQEGKSYRVGDVLISKKGSSHIIQTAKHTHCVFAVKAFGDIKFK